jgi:hypothetical protein
MSSSDKDDILREHGPADGTSNPFERFEEALSPSSVSDAHERGSQTSASSARMERIEGLIAGMAQQFAYQQLQMQAQMREATQAHQSQQLRLGGHAAPSEYSGAGSSVFGDYMKTLDRSMSTSHPGRRCSWHSPRQDMHLPICRHQTSYSHKAQ